MQGDLLDPPTTDPTAVAVPLYDHVPNVRWHQAKAFQFQFGSARSVHATTLGDPMIVNVRYPEFDEPLKATRVGGRVMRLDQASVHVPLTPGDLVNQASGIITGVVRPTPHFIMEAFFPLMCPQSMLDERLARWGAATHVVQSSGCTLRVRSTSHRWLTDEVEGDPDVQLVLLLRAPYEFLDLNQAIRKASGTR